MVSNLPAVQETWHLIPGLGRSPGEGNGHLLQYCCLENPMDGEALWATVHRVAKSDWVTNPFTVYLLNWSFPQSLLLLFFFFLWLTLCWGEADTSWVKTKPNAPQLIGKQLMFSPFLALSFPDWFQLFFSSFLLLLLRRHCSSVQLCVTLWTAAYQASPSMGFSRQEHWSGLPFPSPPFYEGLPILWFWSIYVKHFDLSAEEIARKETWNMRDKESSGIGGMTRAWYSQIG